MSDLVKLTKDGDVGVITINNPPVNALSPGVPEGIVAAVQECSRDAAVKAIVLIGGGRTFCGGADIKEFGKITSGQEAARSDPRSAAVRAGGLPQAGRLRHPRHRVRRRAGDGDGLPLPRRRRRRAGRPAGGQARADPRRGRHAAAAAAGGRGQGRGDVRRRRTRSAPPMRSRAGILDKLIEGDLLPGAVAFAREIVAKGGPPRKTRDLNGKLGDAAANAADLRRWSASR